MATTIPAGAIPSARPAAPPALPRIREDIALLPGPQAADGNRSWLIHDPVRNAFFRIGWREFEILSRWNESSAAAIVTAVRRATPLEVGEDDIGAVARFMTENELTVLSGQEDRDSWFRRLEYIRNKPLSRMFQENLFLRVPLVNPDKFLTATAGFARVFFTRGFWIITLIAAAIALLLVGRQWDSFVATFPYFFSFQGMLIYALALTFAKIVHELGHAYAAKRHGLRVSSMGVAFLVFWPVLFTDTTDSWRLRWGHQRFVVAGAGMAAEIALAAWALLFWSLIPPGPVQSALFALATATWILTLVVNLNPLIRFDGYFLLSDALAVENLQPRSFALLRHYFRTYCLGLTDADPEPALNDRLRRGMTVYAIGALLYRLFLAIGIGVLLYYFAFKILGILALLAVIMIMIVQPMLKEVRTMARSGGALARPGRLALFVALLSTGIALIFYPWQGNVSAPAILKIRAQTHIYSPYAAKLATVNVAVGDRVSKGDPIATLVAPEIVYRLDAAKARAETFRLVMERIGFRPDIADQEPIVRQQLAKAVAEVAGYRGQLDALVLRAPFNGAVVWIPENVRPGVWVRPEMALALVADSYQQVITAYLEESDLARVDVNSKGRFYAFGDTGAPQSVVVESIAPSAVRAIRDKALASVYGGPIPARHTENQEIVPEGGVYEVRLRPTSSRFQRDRQITGIVKIDARSASIARRVWRQVQTVFIRESGF